MSGGWNEVKNDVHPGVLEFCVTLDTRLLGEKSLVLVLDVFEDLDESLRVVDVVTKPWGVDHRQDDFLSVSLNICRTKLRLREGMQHLAFKKQQYLQCRQTDRQSCQSDR